MITIKVNNSMVKTKRIMYYLTGSKDGMEQLKILKYHLIYCFIYGISYYLISTRHIFIYTFMHGGF